MVKGIKRNKNRIFMISYMQIWMKWIWWRLEEQKREIERNGAPTSTTFLMILMNVRNQQKNQKKILLEVDTIATTIIPTTKTILFKRYLCMFPDWNKIAANKAGSANHVRQRHWVQESILCQYCGLSFKRQGIHNHQKQCSVFNACVHLPHGE